MPAQFCISLPKIRRNCEILADVAQQSGAQIALALKAFSLPQALPVIAQYLDGCCASGSWEAQLAHEYFGKQILTCSPAYSEKELSEILEVTTHLDFNSLSQWEKFRTQVQSHSRFKDGCLQIGLRINPEFSTGETSLYDPCAEGSRLGITHSALHKADLTGITSLHFHTLCEQGFTDLLLTMDAVEEKFGHLLSLPQITSLNLGGGHWITQPDYDREALILFLRRLKSTYDLEEIWLEPGEAIAIHSGDLHCEVLDLSPNGSVENALLNISATCHMPDVLEMPYRPHVRLGSGEQGTKQGNYLYRLGGSSCLAGDVIGDYAFTHPLKIGDLLIFEDMAHYTMVKTSFFNGVHHPDICLINDHGEKEILRQFTYQDFKSHLGVGPPSSP